MTGSAPWDRARSLTPATVRATTTGPGEPGTPDRRCPPGLVPGHCPPDEGCPSPPAPSGFPTAEGWATNGATNGVADPAPYSPAPPPARASPAS
ncbi:hypothetical protein ACIO13_16730 [Streptomyces sp. NPDC087425]|uniref:hypothetical protein n=1 Tax=Streptomyces sp. NPDC087425 TaxID=3365787 RepID=UPI0037F3D576